MYGNELSPKQPDFFYPIRYRRARPFVKRAINTFPRLPILPDEHQAKAILRFFQEIYRVEIMKRPFERRPATTHKILDEFECLLKYLQFSSYGRNIFYFHPPLLSMLSNTSADEVPLGLVPFPFLFSYIAFGFQAQLQLDDGFHVDGAYVSKHEHPEETTIQIHLTTVKREDIYGSGRHWLDTPNKYYWLPVKFKGDETVRIASERAFDDEIKLSSEKIESATGEYKIGGRSITVLDRRELTQEERLTHISSGFTAFQRAIQLVVNCVCYLGYPGKDLQTKYIDGAPRGLLDKLSAAETAKKKRRLSSMLESMGFSRIHVCGENIQYRSEPSDGPGEVSSHWRKGHWRNQAHGAMLSERRLIWIRPTLVRPDKGSPGRGHIYDV